jgi:hypothetical protein
MEKRILFYHGDTEGTEGNKNYGKRNKNQRKKNKN